MWIKRWKRSKTKSQHLPSSESLTTLETGAYLHPASNIECPLHLAQGARVNGPLSAVGTGRVHIGRYAAIGRHVTIVTSDHETTFANIQERLQRRIGASSILTPGRTVTLGHNCWIGDGVIILQKAHVGIGAVVGAGSVVTRPVPDFAIAVGNPARVLRYRFSEEIIAFLLQCAWWEWDEEKMRRNKRFFETDLTQITSVETLQALIV